ncbi:hypothetical protein O9992_26155 [Vibrio lentus]|nr:hypothetical protein [Vibrio lentus]
MSDAGLGCPDWPGDAMSIWPVPSSTQQSVRLISNFRTGS